MIKKTSTVLVGISFAFGSLLGCGQVSSGEQAANVSIVNPGEFSEAPSAVKKHVVAVARMGFTVVCSGLVISRNKIAFTHHCTKRFYNGREDAFLYPGSYIIEGGRDVTSSGSDFIMRGHVDDTTLKIHSSRDVVVMRTNRPLPEQYEPVEFFGTSEAFAKGAKVLLTGYGATYKGATRAKRILNYGYMQRATGTTENYKIRLFDETIRGKYYDFSYTHGINLETRSQKSVSCTGDAGGPAFAWSHQDQKWKAVGLISGGNCTDTTVLADIRDLEGFVRE